MPRDTSEHLTKQNFTGSSMYQTNINIRVRYAETDQMGFVYYGQYATYFEVARVEAIRNLGFSYKKLEEMGVLLPVLENYSKFLHPALYDDLLTIKVTIKEMPTLKIIFFYEIFNEEKTLIHIGETKLVFLRKDNLKPCRMPEVMQKLLNPYFT